MAKSRSSSKAREDRCLVSVVKRSGWGTRESGPEEEKKKEGEEGKKVGVPGDIGDCQARRETGFLCLGRIHGPLELYRYRDNGRITASWGATP
jgi:hypothetical protein